jgi:hypothetical protein
VRLRRAMDGFGCAQTLLETMSEIAGSAAYAARTSPIESEAERHLETIAGAMRRSEELLAREWPEEYQVGVVEWLLLGD